MSERILIVLGLGDSEKESLANVLGERSSQLQSRCSTRLGATVANDWLVTLCEVVERYNPSILLVAHSLGCSLVAYLGATPFAKKVSGVFLVAPQDIDYLIKEEGELSRLLGSFTSMPKEALPFKFVVVASSNDPYSTIDSYLSFAKAQEASFVNIGGHGHISAESGHGPWPEGRQLLKNFYPIIAL